MLVDQALPDPPLRVALLLWSVQIVWSQDSNYRCQRTEEGRSLTLRCGAIGDASASRTIQR